MNRDSEHIKMLVFDLDGTLIDSKKDIATAVNLTMVKHGLEPLSDELISKHVGTGVAPLMKSLLTQAGHPSADAAIEDFNQFYREHFTDETKLYEGMEEVLLHFRSLPKVILTNKSNRFVEPMLKRLKLERHFIKAYGRESFATRKPDPGPLRQISIEHKVSPENMVMIGDTDIDILTGIAAGTRTCAVTYGYGENETFLKLNPSYVASTPEELIELFASSVS